MWVCPLCGDRQDDYELPPECGQTILKSGAVVLRYVTMCERCCLLSEIYDVAIGVNQTLVRIATGPVVPCDAACWRRTYYTNTCQHEGTPRYRGPKTPWHKREPRHDR